VCGLDERKIAATQEILDFWRASLKISAPLQLTFSTVPSLSLVACRLKQSITRASRSHKDLPQRERLLLVSLALTASR
jgi:hypothetical protein